MKINVYQCSNCETEHDSEEGALECCQCEGCVELKATIKQMPCYRQWFWNTEDKTSCEIEGIAIENYCPACEANEN